MHAINLSPLPRSMMLMQRAAAHRALHAHWLRDADGHLVCHWHADRD